MKRTVAAILAGMVLVLLAACGGGEKKEEEKKAETFELALITDLGTIDDKSFNQGSWEGMIKYGVEKGITYKYYQPTEQSDDAYLSAIDLAVRGGAKVVVTPGYLFAVPIYVAQDRYPAVTFILVDDTPKDSSYKEKINSNAVGILYAEDQAGFLAGYACVKDGYTKLGFMGGMAVPAVVRYGYGFIQGAETAAQELGLAAGTVLVNYHYTGGFSASPEVQTMAASWYNDGVEVIFGCGGTVGNSVFAAAEQAGKKAIGVDVDQSAESATVITSAMKDLRGSVYSCVSDFYAGKFPGGKGIVLEAANNGVALPMSASKFTKFTQADYDAIYKRLSSGEIPRMNDLDEKGSPAPKVPVKITKVVEV